MKKIFTLSAVMLITGFAFAQTPKKQNTTSSTKTATATVTLSPPPAIDADKLGDGMAGMMNAMGPMVTNMAISMMDAQLAYYKQPGKLEEVAKLQKQYFDALVKEGFTNDQALKIITSDSLLPKPSGAK